ncbi:hypothetical protein PAPHI01_0869 [Pancytospora philotis]|nr:hypothetical protein PAPHI01_0869 [Pancytospora philotis]
MWRIDGPRAPRPVISKQFCDPMDADESQKSDAFCKICTDGPIEGDPLQRPCKCNGSMRYIHSSCLHECLKQSSRCKICNYPFRQKKIYKTDAPGRAPLRCIAESAFAQLAVCSKRLLCAGYLTLRVAAVLGLNGLLMSELVFGSADCGLGGIAMLGALLSVVNFFANYAFLSIYHSTGGRSRLRMNPSRTMRTMASDVLSRADSELSHTSAAGAESAASINASLIGLRNSLDDDDEIDQGSSSASVIDEDGINMVINANLLILPSRPKMLQDLRAVGALVWISAACLAYIKLWSVLYSRMSRLECAAPRRLFAGLLARLIRLVPSVRLLQPCAAALGCLASFVRESEMTVPVIFFYCTAVLLCALTLALHVLRMRVRSRTLCWLYNCGKIFTNLFIGVCHAFLLVGLVFHASVTHLINGGEPIFVAPTYSSAVALHFILGFVFSKFLRSFRERLVGSFRPGLVFNPIAIHSRRELIAYVERTGWGTFAANTVSNTICGSAYAFLLALVLRRYCDGIKIRDWRGVFIAIKLICLFFSTSAEFGNALAMACTAIIKRLGVIWGTNNYIYNLPQRIGSRARLIWDLNINARSELLAAEAACINRVVSQRQSADDSGEDDDAASTSTSMLSELSSIDATIRSRRERRRLADTNYSILRKYGITDRTIEKYYAKPHSGKFSLFYKPRCFFLFKLLMWVFCSSIVGVLTWAALSAAWLACVAFAPENAVAFAFASLYCIKFVAFLLTASVPSICAAPKSLLIFTFVNFVWPAVLTYMYYFYICDSSTFISVSKIFLFFFMLAPILYGLIVRFYFSLPLGRYSYSHVFRYLMSITTLQCVVLYITGGIMRHCSFNGFMIIVLTMYATYMVARGAVAVLNGSWLERIRDLYFLERIDILNYEPDERSGQVADSLVG